jgi:hypothetical protein
MMSLIYKHLVSATLLLGVLKASAFTPLGPVASWQTFIHGYDEIDGGPMQPVESYRWNVPTLYYAYDESFNTFFGSRGVQEVDKAVAMLNALPKASLMESNLTSYPLEARRINYRAAGLVMRDLKSLALLAMVNQVGLADPTRYVWTIREHDWDDYCEPLTYYVIKRNYDPVTGSISSYVNGVLYTYFISEIFETGSDCPLLVRAEAVEVQVDPLLDSRTPVATPQLAPGEYFTSLTRDDVGGIRTLYRYSSGPTNTPSHNNWHYESLPFDVQIQSSPWGVPGGTNTVTNVVSTAAYRAGIDKINFQKVNYDTLLGQMVTPVESTWTDYYATNINGTYSLRSQSVQRTVTQPDILFTAEDGGPGANVLINSPATWTKTAQSTNAPGPGIIVPPAPFTFNAVGPYLINIHPNQLDDVRSIPGVVLGTFDGTTNEPVIYPPWFTIEELEQQVLLSN